MAKRHDSNETAYQIARIAQAAAPLFAAHDLRWGSPDPRERFVPSAADIALAIRDMAADLDPGERLEQGHLVVERSPVVGEPVRVFVHLGDLDVGDGPEDAQGGHSARPGGRHG